jgi:hypothetical protein
LLQITHLLQKPVLNKNNVKTTILAITQKANTIRFRLNLPFNSGIFLAQYRASTSPTRTALSMKLMPKQETTIGETSFIIIILPIVNHLRDLNYYLTEIMKFQNKVNTLPGLSLVTKKTTVGKNRKKIKV